MGGETEHFFIEKVKKNKCVCVGGAIFSKNEK